MPSSIDNFAEDKSIITTHILPDGKILALGWMLDYFQPHLYELLRYNSDGTPDSSFSSNGKVYNFIASTSDTLKSLLVTSDRKIILYGSSSFLGTNDFFLKKFNEDGSPDTSFGLGGFAFSDYSLSDDCANTAFLLYNGKILLGGSTTGGTSNTDFALVRYNTDGSIDNSFGNPAKIIVLPNHDNDEAIAIQSSDNIFLAGYSDGPDSNNLVTIACNSNATAK
jgi:uncharacterized delta-60 repeat protein